MSICGSAARARPAPTQPHFPTEPHSPTAPPAERHPYFSLSSIFRTFPDTVIGKDSMIRSRLGTL